MKKLSILVALILCVTIGGVYAAWLYPSNNSINQVIQPVSNVMAEIEPTGAYGSYHTNSNSLRIVVDQESTTSFKTKLIYEGSLEIKFTPHTSITTTQLDAALGATVSVTGADVATTLYDGKQIWSVDEATKITLDPADWTLSTDGTYYTYVIECSDLENLIGLENTFELINSDQYNEFQRVQKLAVFRVKVTAQTISN